MTLSPIAPLLADSEARTREGGTFGLRTGEVIAIPEDGRYKIRWDSGNVTSDSAHARQATFMAGPNRGAYYPLEIGDEVVCGFREGSIDEPIVLGTMHSDQDPPPPGDHSDTNNTRTLVSREGSELTFDDTAGETSVTLKSAGGIEITLVDGSTDQDPGVLILKLSDTAKIEVSKTSMLLQFDSSNKIELGADGVTVTGTVINLNP